MDDFLDDFFDDFFDDFLAPPFFEDFLDDFFDDFFDDFLDDFFDDFLPPPFILCTPTSSIPLALGLVDALTLAALAALTSAFCLPNRAAALASS